MLKILFSKKLSCRPFPHFGMFSNESKGDCFQELSSSNQDVNEDFLKYIVCPLTKKPLRHDTQRQLLINDELSIGYTISNGIPNMNPIEAIKLDKS